MNPKFKRAVYLAILVVVAIAIFDILSAHSGVFASPEEYTNGYYTEGWWSLFFSFNIILLMVIPISYYFFGRRDKSEAISLFMTSVVMWFTGLADIMYFLLQGKMIPETLPWLNKGVYAGIAGVMGLDMVTRTSLIVTTLFGFTFIYFMNKFMERAL